jgi:energy-coupling factor transporter ATP-binding protein EcfA2
VAKPPLLKIVGLHVEGLRALSRVDWPAAGMGWGDTVPDTVVIGGVNGSGKTTLLELIFDSVRALQGPPESNPSFAAFVQIQVRGAGRDDLFGVSFTRHNPWPVIHVKPKESSSFVLTSRHVGQAVVETAEPFTTTDIPSAIYLPSDRSLVIPDEAYKAAGNLNAPPTFTHRFQIHAKWSESLEAILYAARWADLNALAEGRTEHNFDVYAEAYATFFEGKRIDWHKGELVVSLTDGTRHRLDALSSGEKQVIVIVSELLRRWRPGSLVLIDEPEAHMHPIWVAKLWDLLKRWQRERGGQVIVATQSTQLFGLAEVGTKVLLGGSGLQ